MEPLYADIEIINGFDLSLVRRGIIGENEIKRMQVSFLVDTGSVGLCINENIQEILQLPVAETRKVKLANSTIIECNMADFVELRFKNRGTVCSAIVLPGDAEPKLGIIPLQGMDVIIHPQQQELIVNPNPRLVGVRR